MSFLEEKSVNFIVIFNNDAPDELVEISVLHEITELYEDPATGDTVEICGKRFKITAVGDDAAHTLRTLGHCTLSFQGGSVPERPGCIMLEGDDPLTSSDIQVGGRIEIY